MTVRNVHSAYQNNGKKPDLLRRLGGPSCLELVSKSLSERIKLDPRLKMFFSGYDTPQLTAYHTELLSVILAKTQTHGCCFDVEAFVTAKYSTLFEEGLNEVHFDRIMKHFFAALTDANTEQDVIEDAIDVFGSYRNLFDERERVRKLLDERKASATKLEPIRERVGRSRSGERLLSMFNVNAKKRAKNTIAQ